MDKNRVIQELNEIAETIKLDKRKKIRALIIRISDKGYVFNPQVIKQNPNIFWDWGM